MDFKQQILAELDSRLERLYQHEDDDKPSHENQFEELNHAVSKVIGSSLKKEIEDIRGFVAGLS